MKCQWRSDCFKEGTKVYGALSLLRFDPREALHLVPKQSQAQLQVIHWSLLTQQVAERSLLTL